MEGGWELKIIVITEKYVAEYFSDMNSTRYKASAC